jgi:hypothetical protein
MAIVWTQDMVEYLKELWVVDPPLSVKDIANRLNGYFFNGEAKFSKNSVIGKSDRLNLSSRKGIYVNPKPKKSKSVILAEEKQLQINLNDLFESQKVEKTPIGHNPDANLRPVAWEVCTLDQLKTGKCKYPYDNLDKSEISDSFLFCNGNVLYQSSYCEFHSNMTVKKIIPATKLTTPQISKGGWIH